MNEHADKKKKSTKRYVRTASHRERKMKGKAKT
jgi:hypothetical protein